MLPFFGLSKKGEQTHVLIKVRYIFMKSLASISNTLVNDNEHMETYHICCRSVGMSPQPESGPDKDRGSLHSREDPDPYKFPWLSINYKTRQFILNGICYVFQLHRVNAFC